MFTRHREGAKLKLGGNLLYTLTEARVIIEREACADAGHLPVNTVTHATGTTLAFCKCGAVSWLQIHDEDTPEF